MAKGDDAVNRRRNKTLRKRMRGSESAVSARVASVISAKRRRKAGKRRICEVVLLNSSDKDDSRSSARPNTGFMFLVSLGHVL